MQAVAYRYLGDDIDIDRIESSNNSEIMIVIVICRAPVTSKTWTGKRMQQSWHTPGLEVAWSVVEVKGAVAAGLVPGIIVVAETAN